VPAKCQNRLPFRDCVGAVIKRERLGHHEPVRPLSRGLAFSDILLHVTAMRVGAEARSPSSPTTSPSRWSTPLRLVGRDPHVFSHGSGHDAGESGLRQQAD